MKPGEIRYADKLEVIPPDPTMLAIIKLHLEHLPIMTPEERQTFLYVTQWLSRPAFFVGSNE